jgi:hypothetical protein
VYFPKSFTVEAERRLLLKKKKSLYTVSLQKGGP